MRLFALERFIGSSLPRVGASGTGTGFVYMGSAPKGRPVPCWDLGFGGATLGPTPRPPPQASGRLSPGAAPSLAPCFSAGGIFSNL